MSRPRRRTPRAEQIRAQLARFLFRGADGRRRAAALSGGERLRAALAMLLLAEPAAAAAAAGRADQQSRPAQPAHLTQALAGFEGALIVVSHDPRFLDEIGVTRRLELTADGLVEDGAPAASDPEDHGEPVTG